MQNFISKKKRVKLSFRIQNFIEMKKRITILLMFVLLIIGWNKIYDSETVQSKQIKSAISSADVSLLTDYFGANTQINLMQTNLTCNKEQAEIVLGKFFLDNKPEKIKFGNNPTHINGSFSTSNGENYQVYYTLKKIQNDLKITDFSIIKK